MPSITDQAAEELRRKPRETVQTLREIAGIVNGICISFTKKGHSKLNRDDVMDATKKAYLKSMSGRGHPRGTQISIRKLEASARSSDSKIEKLSEPVTDDLLSYFRKHCRKYGIQYSVLKEQTKNKEDRYYIFFKSDDAASIKNCIEMGMRDYTEDKKHPQKEKESVMDKLRHYVDLVKQRDAMAPQKEKHHHRSGRSK